MKKLFFFYLILFNTGVLSNSCGSPFLGWRPPPRWNIIADEIEKAGKSEYYQPVQIRKKCISCEYAGYDLKTGYVWVKHDSSVLIPKAEQQFRKAIREWIKNGIEYYEDDKN